MALVIIQKNGEKFSRHIPWQDNFVTFVQRSSESIATIHADGDELEYIKRCFVNVPYCHAHTTWSGDWAQFVAQNFPYYISPKKALENIHQSTSTTCTECKGRGMVGNSADNEITALSVKCRRCNGTGRIVDEDVLNL